MPSVIPVDSDERDLLEVLEAVWDRGGAALPVPGGRTEPLPPAPAGTALVVRTSGTRGRPRHVALAHRAVEAAVAATLERLSCQPGERWALALPTAHIAGILVLLRAQALGTTPIRIDRPGAAEVLANIEAEHVAIVPTQLVRAMRAGVDLRRFRTVLVGGGPLDPRTRDEARRRRFPVVESYGATETCGGCVYDGTPLEGVRIRIGADDEVMVTGATLASGYLDDPEATHGRFRDGWFATGDVGRLVGGRLEVLGRRDDVAVSGGVNVPLAPVASALLTAQDVVDAVAVGVPDPEWGVAVRAVVVPAAGARPRLADLRAHVTATLPRPHAPRELLLVDRIERDGLGKVTAAVRATLADAPASERLQ